MSKESFWWENSETGCWRENSSPALSPLSYQPYFHAGKSVKGNAQKKEGKPGRTISDFLVNLLGEEYP
jgi:hypothetical protein